MIVALASPRPAASLDDGLDRIRQCLADASARGARIICFPEAYLPGLRGQDFEVIPWDERTEEFALEQVGRLAHTQRIVTIMGMERITPAGRQIVAVVFGVDGRITGVQSKNQLDPSEDRYYVPGTTRGIFEADGVKFGVVICHEGWRYPETVRWAAIRGAKIVFHPQHTGAEKSGPLLAVWGAPANPYYEKAMMCRGLENTIWFASVNYGLKFQEAATSIIDPQGKCEAFLPYGEAGTLVHDVDIARATGLLASRFAPDRYQTG